MRILIPYAPNIAKYINAKGKKMKDQKILLKRDGLISNPDLFISSVAVR